MNDKGWIGVDLDGTLARYDGWIDGGIGEPIPAMVDRVKGWLGEGKEIRIFTARVAGMYLNGAPEADIQFALLQRGLVQTWCLNHLGTTLPVTAVKDLDMIELWDDRAVEVVKNTGKPATLLAYENGCADAESMYKS